MTTIHTRGGASLKADNAPVFAAYLNLVQALNQKDARDRRLRAAFADIGPVVYYIWRPPYIKVGYTTDLRNRLSTLRCTAPQVIALQPGSLDDESAMHERFNTDRAYGDGLGREHFWPGEKLLAHINGLRSAAGLPQLAVGLRLVS